MTREDIIAMASKAFEEKAADVPNVKIPNAFIERFSALIAAAAKAEEREACAKVCDDLTVTDGLHQAKYCANAIRARGETK